MSLWNAILGLWESILGFGNLLGLQEVDVVYLGELKRLPFYFFLSKDRYL